MNEELNNILEVLSAPIKAKSPAVFRSVTSTPLATIDEVSDKLNSILPSEGYLKFICDGESHPAPVIHAQWRDEWDGAALKELWDAGCAMIVHDGKFNGKIQALIEVLRQRFNRGCDAHIYFGGSGSGSFNVHSDTPDNLIIQAEGATHWTVFEERWNPLKASNTNLDKNSLTPVIDTVLEPGDAIFVDKWRLHLAEPLGRRLSVSIPMPPLEKTERDPKPVVF